MIRAARALTGAVAMLLGAPPAAAAPDARFAVAPVRSDWDAARIVGRRGAGAVCAPAGGIAWRDVALDPARAADRIAHALKAAGTDVLIASDDDPPAPPRYRIVARITDLRLAACTPHFGIVRVLGGRTLKGSGRLTIAWQVHGGLIGADAPPRDVTVDFAFRGVERTLPDALMEGVDANARVFAQGLAAMIGESGEAAP